MEKDKHEPGHRPFLSLLNSVWQGHDKDAGRGSGQAVGADTSRDSASSWKSSSSRRNKAIRNIGEGSFSLDDLDNSMTGSKQGAFKNAAITSREKTVQQQIPDVKFASDKRNADFHKLFHQNIADNEPLIEDCSCAITREILVQGRCYITPYHVCFHSNILGRTTHLVISFQEILEIKPKNTVGLFPNGIVIRGLHAQHTFASFVNRDHVLKLLKKLKDSRLTTGKNGVDNLNSSASDGSSLRDSDSSGDEWIEESSFKRRSSSSSSFSFNSSGLGDSEDGYSSSVNAAPRHRSRSSTRTEKTKARPKFTTKNSKESIASSEGGSGKWPVENLGPEKHKPTGLPELDGKEKLVDSFTISAPLGVVANLIYGQDTTWYYRFHTEDLKNRDLDSIPPFDKSSDKPQRYFEYTKPLNGPVGPKQTHCKCTEIIDKWDMEDRVQILTSNKTPDVPSGDAFTTFTRCTMVWAEGNQTTVRHTTWLEWTGKSWLKKPIENGAMDGQQQYCKTLNASLQQKLKPKSNLVGKGKRSRKKNEFRAPGPSAQASNRGPQSSGLSFLMRHSNYILYIGIAVVSMYLMRLVYNHFGDGASQQHKMLEQQLDLWQWLDSRLENKSSFNDVASTLTNQEIDEVIRLAELRLGRLRAIRNQRGD